MKGTPVDAAALRALHEDRFAELPFDCSDLVNPGIDESEEWRDWSTMPTTPDQLRIEGYLEHFALRKKRILHVGCGNSHLAARFSRSAEAIVGTTIVRAEVDAGNARQLRNYRVVLHNKYLGAQELGEGSFDFVIDNNPTTFCCCLTHLAAMLSFYAGALRERGQVVTDRVGLGWSLRHSNPRWGFTAADLSAVAQLVGLGTYEVGPETIVLAREAPSRASPAGRLRRLLRKVRRVLTRFADRGRLLTGHG